MKQTSESNRDKFKKKAAVKVFSNIIADRRSGKMSRTASFGCALVAVQCIVKDSDFSEISDAIDTLFEIDDEIESIDINPQEAGE